MSADTLQQLLAALEREGSSAPGTAARAREHLGRASRWNPWYVHALLAVAAWLVMLLLLVVLLGVDLIDDTIGAASVGGVLLAAALALRHGTRAAFPAQLALALSLTGIALVTFAAMRSHDEVGFGLALLGLAGSLLFAYPDALQRFLCTLLAVLGARVLVYAADNAAASTGLVLVVAAACTGMWLFDARAPEGWLVRNRRPLGYGLAVSLMALVAPTAPFGDLNTDLLLMPLPGIASAGLTLVFIAAGARVATRIGVSASNTSLAVPLAVATLLAGATYQTPGVVAALLLALLAQHREERALLGLSVVAAVASLGAFYYQLELSLPIKAASLAAGGLALLAVRLVVRRMAVEPADHRA